MSNYIRLSYTTRKGHFNWSDPSEESYSCHMAVFDDEGNKLISCNIHPEYEEDGNDPESAIYLLEDAISRTWTTNDNRPDFLQFIKDNQEALEVGNNIYELEQITKQILKLSERQLQLSQRLSKTDATTDYQKNATKE